MLRRFALRNLFGCLAGIFAAILLVANAHAGGPRWYAGPGYFDPAALGQPVVWSNGRVAYYTDQGNLSASVSQAQANAMVATAAAVWNNVSTAAVAITRAGSLAEDVNGTNVTNGSSSIVEPADIQSSATTLPVAVVYDADGSVIDALYGQGASSATVCQQNGVLTVVDNFSTAGNIAHALMLVNGLCATTTTQIAILQYQLIRGFGRVLGLDWSDANEEMFVNDQITTNGLTGWPILHPVEHLCQQNSTLCIPNATTLRLDDIAALNRAYPVTAANHSLYPGKTLTASATFSVQGVISFKRGQGMQGVNVVLRPLSNGQADVRYTVTAVSGASFLGQAGNPINGTVDANGNPLNRFGSDNPALEGFYDLSGVPLPPGTTLADYQLSFEAINPNFTEEYSVGPYLNGQVSPSGTMPSITLPGVEAGMNLVEDVTIADSADELHSGADGTESAPALVAASGEWSGRIAGYGHTAWFEWWAKANREFTVEVQAIDESDADSENKLRGVIGLWNGTDALGTLPVTGTLQPYNGDVVGLTTLSAVSTASSLVRLAVADDRGDGRPDYAYQGRVLYADSVTPARLPAAGGAITITGMGFRSGAAVTVNGVAAQVSSVSPTQITAIAPPSNGATGTVLLVVEDPQTLGVATIGDGLSYNAQNGDALSILTAPSGALPMGVPVVFSVRALGSDLTPAAGVIVTFAVTEGAAQLGCGTTSCQVVTAADGTATLSLNPASTALTQITASLSSGASVLAEFTGSAPSAIYAVSANLYAAIGGSTAWPVSALVLQSGLPAAGASVLWQTTGQAISIESPAISSTNTNGFATAQLAIGPVLNTAPQTVNACLVGSGSCATFTVLPVHVETALLQALSGTTQSVSAAQALAPVVLQVTDAVGHPMAGATVTFYETLSAWAPACGSNNVCPAPQMLAQQSVQAVSASDGSVTLAPLSNQGIAAMLVVQATVGGSTVLDFELQQAPVEN